MEVIKVTLWGLNEDKWVKRRSFDFDHEFKWNRSEFAKPYEENYGMIHAFFPKGVNPNDFPIIFKMLKVVNKKVKCYVTDFYYHDCISLFQHEQNVLWSVRESGTYMFAVDGDYHDEECKDSNLQLYRYSEGGSYHYYHINDGNIKKITFEKGLVILENKPVKEVVQSK